MSTRRILLVTSAYDPHEAHGTTIDQLVRAYTADHALACAVRRSPSPTLTSVEALGGNEKTFGFLDADRLRAVVERFDPDVVHFHGGPVGALAPARGWTGGRPAVVTMNGWPRLRAELLHRSVALSRLARTPVLHPQTAVNTVLPPRLVAAALRRAGVGTVITPDPEIAARLAVAGTRVFRYAGVTPPTGPARPATRPRFVFAGRAELTRGPDLLAAAARSLRAAGRSLQVDYLLLPGPDLDVLRGLAVHHDDRCRTEPADLRAELDGATAVVLPFRYEHTTLTPTFVAAEALAAGVPVIAGDVGCIRGAVEHDVTGLLTRRNDPVALAAAMARVLDEPGLGARLGGEGLRRATAAWADRSLATAAADAYAHALTTGHDRTPTTGRAA
jgi:starch synthase